MLDRLNGCHRLIQEHEVIRENLGQLSRLTEEFVNLAGIQNSPVELNLHQISYLNEKRINLKHNLMGLKEGLQVHYYLEEEIMRPSISHTLMQKLKIQHEQILKKLSEIHAIILNLSPMGTLFNSIYLKHAVDTVCLVISDLSYQENSLLAFSGTCQDELFTSHR